MESTKFNWLHDLGLLLMRGVLGTVFVYHGAEKLFGFPHGGGLGPFAQYLSSLGIPYPAYGAALAGLAEFVGGLALVTGYGFRLLMLPLVVTMGVAVYFVHRHAFTAQQNGMEYPLTLGVVILGLVFTGPGRWRLPDLSSGVAFPTLPRVSMPQLRRKEAKKFRTELVSE